MSFGLNERQEELVRSLWLFENEASRGSFMDYEWNFVPQDEVERIIRNARRAFKDFDKLAEVHHEILLQEEFPGVLRG
jgi:hypothetical protein